MSLHDDIDRSLLELDRELRELGRVEVNRAAKERGWAALERELERRPVGSARKVPSARGRSAGRRWALSSLAAAVMVVALVLGLYGGTVWIGADSGRGPGPVTSVVSSGEQGTGTTSDTIPTSVTTEPTSSTEGEAGGPGTTQGTAGTTQDTDSSMPPTSGGQTPATGGQSPSSTSGGASGSAGGSTATTARSTTTQGPATTEPQSTTTTQAPQFATAQRDKTAKAAALDLGALVMEYFMSGDMSGARALVAAEAQSSLVQMIGSLDDPYGFRWLSTKAVSTDTVRVILEFNDRVPNGRGELEETTKRYALTIKVSDDSAVVTAITAAP